MRLLFNNFTKRAKRDYMLTAKLGIAGNIVLHPSWRLGNKWFEKHVEGWGKKFLKHSGVQERGIFEISEMEAAKKILDLLFKAYPKLEKRDCLGGICIMGSGVPPQVLDNLSPEAMPYKDKLQKNNTLDVCKTFVRECGFEHSHFECINWGCSAFSRALQLILERAEKPCAEKYFLVVITAKLSEVLDYSDLATGGLFGDLATATLLTFSDNPNYRPSHYVVSAKAEALDVGQEIFGYKLGRNILVPSKNGGQARDPMRLVFFMDPKAVAANATEIMRNMVLKALAENEVPFPSQILPHQASRWVVEWLKIRLEEKGINVPVLNGLICNTGNVSGSSIPSALDVLWQRGEKLLGTTICPTVGIGWPNTPTVSAGYFILQSAQK